MFHVPKLYCFYEFWRMFRVQQSERAGVCIGLKDNRFEGVKRKKIVASYDVYRKLLRTWMRTIKLTGFKTWGKKKAMELYLGACGFNGGIKWSSIHYKIWLYREGKRDWSKSRFCLITAAKLRCRKCWSFCLRICTLLGISSCRVMTFVQALRCSRCTQDPQKFPSIPFRKSKGCVK